LQNIIRNQEMRPEDIDNVLSEITQTQRSSLQDAEVIPFGVSNYKGNGDYTGKLRKDSATFSGYS
jgi:hypothetical protein